MACARGPLLVFRDDCQLSAHVHVGESYARGRETEFLLEDLHGLLVAGRRELRSRSAAVPAAHVLVRSNQRRQRHDLARDRRGRDPGQRDAAIGRLPQVVGPNRPGYPPLPESAVHLELPARLHAVSSTGARTTNPEWMTPPARKTAELHGIWGL